MVSKRQAILDWLVDDAGPLKAINGSGGYVNTISLLQRGQRDMGDLSDADFPCLFISSTDENRQSITAVQYSAELTALLIGAVKSLTGVGGVQAALDTLIADVTKALMTDHTQGGRTYSTNVSRIRTDPGDIFPHAACVIEVVFKYATEGTIP